VSGKASGRGILLRRRIGGMFLGAPTDEGEYQGHGWLWRGGLAVAGGGDSVWRIADERIGDSDRAVGGLAGGARNAGGAASRVVASSTGKYCQFLLANPDCGADLHSNPHPRKRHVELPQTVTEDWMRLYNAFKQHQPHSWSVAYRTLA